MSEPMFSSNQIFQVSGTLDDIERVLDFAIRQSGEHELFTRTESPVPIVYQITDNGLYCLATAYGGTPDEDWSLYPFDYDPKIIARIIRQWLELQPRPKSDYDCCEGGHAPGFICQELWSLDPKLRDHIKSPYYGFLTFRPFTNWYSK